MISKEDINALDLYFKSLEVIPESLTVVVQKIDKANIINEAQDALILLMESGSN